MSYVSKIMFSFIVLFRHDDSNWKSNWSLLESRKIRELGFALKNGNMNADKNIMLSSKKVPVDNKIDLMYA